jgi:hypothetical protein
VVDGGPDGPRVIARERDHGSDPGKRKSQLEQRIIRVEIAVMIVTSIIVFLGVVSAMGAMLILAVLLERWLPAEEPLPSSVEYFERPLVRIIAPKVGRGKAA